MTDRSDPLGPRASSATVTPGLWLTGAHGSSGRLTLKRSEAQQWSDLLPAPGHPGWRVSTLFYSRDPIVQVIVASLLSAPGLLLVCFHQTFLVQTRSERKALLWEALRGSGIEAHIRADSIFTEKHTKVWAIQENPQNHWAEVPWENQQTQVLEWGLPPIPSRKCSVFQFKKPVWTFLYRGIFKK